MIVKYDLRDQRKGKFCVKRGENFFGNDTETKKARRSRSNGNECLLYCCSYTIEIFAPKSYGQLTRKNSQKETRFIVREVIIY